MNQRHVTAVVLLSGSTTLSTHQQTTDALAAQARAPERVIAVAPSTLDPAIRARLDRDRDAGAIDEIIDISATVGRAGAIREVLELISRRGDSDAAARGSAAHENSHDPVIESPVPEPQRTGRRGGRRAAEVDRKALERRRTQEAEHLARVPIRLREERRMGRRAEVAGRDENWLWFLVDGSPPGHDALEQQLDVIGRSPNTAVVGAKRVRYSGSAAATWDPNRPRTADAADALVDVGLTLTHGGRIITGVDAGEIDQGQADWRQDVLAVALPGMLIRERTLRGLDGLDPDLPEPWAEIDLCHRVWRSGERVTVQSRARVLFPDPSRPALERAREQRTGQFLVLLKHRPAVLALVMVLLSPLTVLLRMIGAIAVSEPRRAVTELTAWLSALPLVPRILRRGRLDRRRASVPEGRLAPLYLPRAEGVRRRLDDIGIRLFADDDRARRIRRTTWGIAGTRHGIDDADYGRHVVWTVVVALAASVLSLAALRDLFGRGELSGPALSTLPRDWRDTWEAAWSTWVPQQLGARGPGDPLVRLLGHVPVDGSVLVETIIFCAIPLSALFSWWAAGAITRAVGARLVLTVTWALAPSLLSALDLGAWPLAMVHLLLPLLALAVGRAIGLPHKVSQASIPAAAVGGLLLLVLGAVQPALVILVAAGLALVAAAVPGRRLRLLWVLIPSLALHLPYLPVYLGHPRTLLAVAGTSGVEPTASTLDVLMLWPHDPGLDGRLSSFLGAIDPVILQWLPALPLVPVVAAALFAPVLRGPAGLAGRVSVLMAAAGMLAVLVAASTVTSVAGGKLVPPPVHALLSLVLLALMIGAGASFDALARRGSEDSRVRSTVTAVTGGLVAAVCVITVAGWSVLLPGGLAIERTDGGRVPAAAADQGRADTRARVMLLEQTGDGDIEATVIVHGADSIIQNSAIASARQVETVLTGEQIDADPGSTALRDAVAVMLTGSGDSAEPDAGSAGDSGLSALALSYVVVPGDPSEQDELVSALDASTLLEKVTASSSGGMWRVIDATPNAHVRDGDEVVPLSSGAVGAQGEVPAADDARTVVLAQRFDGQWRGTLDGNRLEPVLVDGWAQGFVLPAGAAGHIEIEREQPARVVWQLALYSVIVLTVLVAVPWRPRAGAAEELYG